MIPCPYNDIFKYITIAIDQIIKKQKDQIQIDQIKIQKNKIKTHNIYLYQIIQQQIIILFIHIHQSFMQSLPQIQNIVSLVKLNHQQIDISLLSAKIANSRYNPKRFPALIIRKTDPKCTVLVFTTGKLVLLGSRDEKITRLIAEKTIKQIGKLLILKLKLIQFAIVNLIAKANIGFPINVTLLSMEHFTTKIETFKGVVYRMNKPVKVVMIFKSGKLIFTGAKSKKEVQEAFEILKQKLVDFKFKKKLD